jgi:squalene-associated FAD-dependent desaturase
MTLHHADRATAHIVGAGLAGLAAAVRLCDAGHRVRVYEAAPQAGGRCRSFYEPALERWIDNGNHLILSANNEIFAYLDAVGARGALQGPDHAIFPFLDLKRGLKWAVKPNDGKIAWWLFDEERRVPETGPLDYLAMLRLAFAGKHKTVAQALGRVEPLYSRLFEPLTVAVLNTSPDEGAASLLWAVIARTFLKGGEACRPFVARDSLSTSLVEPALAHLKSRNAEVSFHRRLRGVVTADQRVTALNFTDAEVAVAPGDSVVLAVPSWNAQELLPWLIVPEGARAILNAHFRLAAAEDLGPAPFIGLIGGTAHWLFVRGDVAAVTVSDADALLDLPNKTLAERLWRDVALALGLAPSPVPPYRIIKEKRATFAQTPANLNRRPRAETPFSNLFLAGDWTDTGLPATLESAVASGHMAADRVRRYHSPQ